MSTTTMGGKPRKIQRDLAPDPRLFTVLTRARPVRGLGPLTRREVQVLELVADGLTNVQVGARLGLSPWTVKCYLGQMGEKLGVSGGRAGLVGAAFRRGVLS